MWARLWAWCVVKFGSRKFGLATAADLMAFFGIADETLKALVIAIVTAAYIIGEAVVDAVRTWRGQPPTAELKEAA